jgi:primase-polymerase (primpol)-like protein
MTLMDSLGVEYVEYSPSGHGLRGFGYAENLESGVNGIYGDLKVELYSNVRFMTVTGHTIEGGPIVPLSGFSELAERIRGNKKVNTATGKLERVPAAMQQGQLVVMIQ